MDQQRSALLKYIIKSLSCLTLSLTYVLSLNRQMIDQRLSDQSFDQVSVCWILDQPSFSYHLNSSTSRREF